MIAKTSGQFDIPLVALLEEKHMVTILLFLMDNDGCAKTDLYSSVSRGTRMPNKLDILENAGLIVQNPIGPCKHVRISLTRLGREVCKELGVIEGMLEGYNGGSSA